MVIDYSLYRMWEPIGNKDYYTTEEDIAFYYAHVIKLVGEKFAGMGSGMYNYILSVVGLHISKTRKEYTIMRDGSKGRGKYRDILFSLGRWLKAREKALPEFEVAVLFTRHKAILRNPGRAVVASVCSSRGVFVVYQGRMSAMALMASHELAHVLGARHDGELNGCDRKEFHIMDQDFKGNGTIEEWTFSNCSVRSIDEYVRLVKRHKKRCFYGESHHNNEFEFDLWSQVNKQPPGARFAPNMSCQIMFGRKSYHCTMGADNSSDNCLDFKCFDPQSKECVLLSDGKALEGTPCSFKSWCMGGRCMHDERAPTKDEYFCPHGDWKRPMMVGLKNYWCRNVQEMPSLCYHSQVKKRCCTSCHSEGISVEDCQNGDVGIQLKFGPDVLNCTGLSKHLHLCLQHMKLCCQTCSKALNAKTKIMLWNQ